MKLSTHVDLTMLLVANSRIVFLGEDTIVEIKEHSEGGFEYNLYDDFNQEPRDGGVITDVSHSEIIEQVIGEL